MRRSLAAALLSCAAGAAFALGGAETPPPSVLPDVTGEIRISPQSSPGTQDILYVPLAIAPAQKMVIKGWRLVVTDAAGQPVRTIETTDPAPPPGFFVRALIAVGLKQKTGLQPPSYLVWDGKDEQGRPVAEGSYTYRIEAWDDKGETGRSPDYRVIVDNTPPRVEVHSPYLVFSPNGDGNKDLFIVEQSGSSEAYWRGVISDSEGRTVFERTWENGPPANFSWDGTGPDGRRVADGAYSYSVSAVDQAGNLTEAGLQHIVVDTKVTTASLSRDLSQFSPNGDQVKDLETFTLDVPVRDGVVGWTLVVADSAGTPRRTFRGNSAPPARVVFDGKDDSGRPLGDGAYTARLSVSYLNGNNPTDTAPQLEIDLTAPTATARADLAVFSPDGDGNKDFVTISQNSSEEDLWTGVISDASGKAVRQLTWRGKVDPRVQWDGRDDENRLVPDGVYTYRLAAVDRAGNSGQSAPLTMEKDTRNRPPLTLSGDAAFFSPNGDGVRDTLTLSPGVTDASGVDHSLLTINDAKGKLLRSRPGTAGAPAPFVWDGRDDLGVAVPDGAYTATLEVVYRNGSVAHVVAGPFVVDTRLPEVSLQAPYLLFSPDGDGHRDTLSIRQTSSIEDLWEAEVLDSSGRTVASRFWKGAAGDFVWDGTADSSGSLVPDGAYTYRVHSTDRAGNTRTAELAGIRVDTRPTPLAVTAGAAGFSPNGDAQQEEMPLNLYVGLTDGVTGWRLAIVGAGGGAPVRVIEGAAGTPLPSRLFWDGRRDDGTPASEGSYRAELTVSYEKGNQPVARTAESFTLDITPPVLSLSAVPSPFSPDGDGVDDTVTLRGEARDPAGVASWTIRVLDPADHEFITFHGDGAPSAPIVWNGLSPSGELVQAAEDYRAVFTASDVFGNTASTERKIPVDVLVMREGDRLKIRIASINFAPNTADFVNVDPEQAAKNRRTVDRLAEILKKYPDYQISIEGYATYEWWNVPERARREQVEELIPLSRKRADAIRQALVDRGIQGARMTTEGLGGDNPVVPYGDLDNRWKNRRVEFILVKK